MPEYLTPGVYVEETSFRSRSIEGVPTSTFGMAGRTSTGPVPYAVGGTTVAPGPALVTSFTEYERAFGGLTVDGDPCWLAFAARAFFANGGRRLYVSRVFSFTMTTGPHPVIDQDRNFAALALPLGATTPLLRWRARWPGTAAAQVNVSVTFRRSKNVLVGGRLTGVQPGAAVELVPLVAGQPKPIADKVAPDPAKVMVVARGADGVLGYVGAGPQGVQPVDPNTGAYHLTLAVTVRSGAERTDVYNELELADPHPRSVANVLQAADPADEFALVWLETVAAAQGQPAPAPGALLAALLTLDSRDGAYLSGGGPGQDIGPDELLGHPADPDSIHTPATGLEALGEIDDIAVVATPDSVSLGPDAQLTAVQNLIGHCERLRYRMAVVDPPLGSSISEVRRFRSQFDTSYAALYYPWVRIVDPTRRPDPSAPQPLLDVPPSGYVAGVYARSDIERGVHKAPANEVVLGITDFTTNVTYDRQAVLNPEGINALRFFEGRARRIWGARTMSSDPEWKYVNVRRLFLYLEHSIDKSTQWAVFEPNNERLWASVRQSVEDFLLATWKTGALMGTKPEEAYFVRCDRTTMTQNDLDNGRLICLIGVAPTYPAEFVIFRIGQFTADAQDG
ncbi:phage tail sheath family protein [Saccharothrix sp. ST-888]|uniref:phage tail sheath family protein n=1 Tax=Saccharothrix sp. ST-888 TaxID=1427391 RepID=UPI0005EC92FF|nr:phage tail sheath subtilisin-like domain-containing protein [Saccharothrix sp. ST-888]KJK59270.1 hypothetical protein UK12_05445 [Saccharothrix sp. ST-888]